MYKVRNTFLLLLVSIATMTLVASCARMGNPDGGWYDETPPRVIGATPDDKGTDVKNGKVQIRFSEFIKLENAQEKVVISPPQMEQPDIKAQGKRIIVNLKDSLKDNTTYTIDFSDAISDNNEGNPLGAYTYSFSTGKEIDTLEVSGRVLDASNLEPIKGILVGLTTPDSIGGTMLRVSRSDSYGRFVIRGIAPGTYCCYALNDMDGNYQFSQRAEQLAYSHDTFTPTCRPDTRQDTIWIDSLHIKDILPVGYTHFFPDDITLLAFNHDNQDRYFLKTERTDADHFTMFFTGPGTFVPKVELLDYDIKDPFIIEPTEHLDTITYWIRDTMLVNKDTLRANLTYEITDSLGNLTVYTDSLVEILAKTPYEKRMKQHREEVEKWEKEQAKLRKKGQEITDSVMPEKRLEPKYSVSQSINPNSTLHISFPVPLERFDSAAIHIYCMVDSVWYNAPFDLQRSTRQFATPRDWDIIADWLPDTEYSFEVDTLAFTDIYGKTSVPYKTGFKVKSLDSYSSLFVNVSGIDLSALNTSVPVAVTTEDTLATSTSTAVTTEDTLATSTSTAVTTEDTLATSTSTAVTAENTLAISTSAAVNGADSVSSSRSRSVSNPPQIVVQLLDGSDKTIMEAVAVDGTAEFYYVNPGKYYMRAFIDNNGNGKWDTGDFYENRQPEQVFYYPNEVECKAKWDITKSWNLTRLPLSRQKPGKLTKQKGEKAKTIKNRNAQRAAEKGIQPPQQ